MRKIFTLLSILLFLSLSLTASAFEADFSAKIRDVNTESDADVLNARIISTANFENTDIQRDGSFTIAYSVTSAGSDIYIGSATIDSDDAEVIIGNARIGRIKITHDAETGIIKTRFVQRVIHDSGLDGDTSSTSYTVVATSGTWRGESTITSAFVVEEEEINFPEQITIEGTAVVSSEPYSLGNSIDITINDVVVYSGFPNDASFSINVDTGIDSDSQNSLIEIKVDIYALADDGNLKASVLRFLLPNVNETVYDFGEIELQLVPQ